jgi:hypothetical protein
MFVLALLASAGAAGASGAEPGPQRGYQPLRSRSLVQDKDFYLLTLLQQLPAARRAIQSDPDLAAEALERRRALQAAQKNCAGQIACELAAYRWSEARAAQLGDAVAAALQRAGALDEVVKRHMRPSGRFILYADLTDAELVRRAWRDAVQGMDRIDRVYGLGEKPLYPLIDSSSYAADNPDVRKMWKDAIGDLVDVDLDDPANGALFFDLPLGAALSLLDMNDRNEPARLEPLDQGENAAAFAYARTLDWRAWRYPVMLIPGRSPVLPDNPLSPEAKQKMRLAARRFRQGLAPIIVVSGGYVLPSQTRFAEALEMKRELMRTYGIPERAILVDPYARHTTTNLRNTERLLFEIGAPSDRPILVTTTAYQSGYIEGQVFHDRCLRELGYLCFTDLHRLSMFDTVLTLPLVSLQRDARDPLDP